MLSAISVLAVCTIFRRYALVFKWCMCLFMNIRFVMLLQHIDNNIYSYMVFYTPLICICVPLQYTNTLRLVSYSCCILNPQCSSPASHIIILTNNVHIPCMIHYISLMLQEYGVRVVVLNNISVISRSVSLVEETGISGEYHRPADNVMSSTPRLSGIRTHNVSSDRH